MPSDGRPTQRAPKPAGSRDVVVAAAPPVSVIAQASTIGMR